MKYSVNTYAKALAEVAMDPKTNEAEAIKNFLALVRRNGDESHLRNIVAAAARLMWGKAGMRKVTIESARKLAYPAKTMFSSFIKPQDIVEEKINSELVAGVRIIVNEDLQFDGSLKGKLDKLFSTL